MEIDQANVGAFLGRFYDLENAVVAHVDLGLRPRPLVCTIDVHARDRQTPDAWSVVRLVVREANEFRFALGIRSLGSTVLPDLSQSKGYVAGTSCSWEHLGPAT